MVSEERKLYFSRYDSGMHKKSQYNIVLMILSCLYYNP